MAEVEAQPVGRHERPLLRDMLAEPPAQRLVQQVGHRVVGAQLAAAQAVDPQLDGIAYFQRAAGYASEMNVKVTRLLYRVTHRQLCPGSGKDDPRIPGLPARLAVKRRLVDDHRDLVAESCFCDALVAPHDR